MTENTINDMQIEFNNTTDPSYREIFNLRKELVCLLPNVYREEITVSLPNNIENQDILFKAFSESIQMQYTKMKIFIISIRKLSDPLYQLEYKHIKMNAEVTNNKEHQYYIVYIMVPNELINRFKNEGINNIKVYIGKSKNKNEFKILDKPPNLSMISIQNARGVPLPFSWVINLS
jgi:hypothetical protein